MEDGEAGSIEGSPPLTEERREGAVDAGTIGAEAEEGVDARGGFGAGHRGGEAEGHGHRRWRPHGVAGAVTEGGRPATFAYGVRFLRMENGAAVFETGSGSYTFGA